MGRHHSAGAQRVDLLDHLRQKRRDQAAACRKGVPAFEGREATAVLLAGVPASMSAAISHRPYGATNHIWQPTQDCIRYREFCPGLNSLRPSGTVRSGASAGQETRTTAGVDSGATTALPPQRIRIIRWGPLGARRSAPFGECGEFVPNLRGCKFLLAAFPGLHSRSRICPGLRSYRPSGTVRRGCHPYREFVLG
jgi:hypothetical protein